MKYVNNNLAVSIKALMLTSLFASGTGVYADDTEVFYSPDTSKPNLMFVLDYSASMAGKTVSGSDIGNGNRTRLEVLRSSMRAVLESVKEENVNIGIVPYGIGQRANTIESVTSAKYKLEEGKRTHGVNGISFPLRDINAKANETITDATGVGTEDYSYLPNVPGSETTVGEYIADLIDFWETEQETPIVDALYEAALYYRGERMYYGHHQPNEFPAAHPSTYVTTGVSIIGSEIDLDDTSRESFASTAPNYISPMTSRCQSNYIVMMSDGGPAYRYNPKTVNGVEVYGPIIPQTKASLSPRKNLQWRYRGPFAQDMASDTGFGKYSDLADAIDGGACEDAPSDKTSGKCGPELMSYLAENDNSDEIEGTQTIKSFIIGFGGLDDDENEYLESLTTATYDDDGDEDTDEILGYFVPESEAELVAAFKTVLGEVIDENGTSASPGYSVNVRSGLEHENDVYIPVFENANTSRWSGNLKKFKLEDDDGLRKIRGSNGLDVVDELGSFTADALDYWSDSTSADGSDVGSGGLANLLNPSVRNIVSDLDGNNLSELAENNTLLTNSALGLATGTSGDYRNKVINFMRGWEEGEASSTPRYHMGDMLHSEPVVITYDDGADSGTKDQYVFVGTNEGYIHAFNTADDSEGSNADAGKEMFAFIPSELLSTISEPQFLNAGTQEDHKYGIDGSMTYRFIDENDDGIVNENDDQVIIYFGLRRGGSSYYALDVTDIDSPELLWKVTNPMDGDADNPLSRLGQSWSTPYLARVGVDDSSSTCTISGAQKTHCREVVIVTGGYDVADDRNLSNSLLVDDSTSSVTATVGNDVFIFDANDGELVWSLPSSLQSKLTNSVPGGVRILDTNSNNMIDRMYFGDTGGNLWRLDLSESLDGSDSESTLEKLGNLSSGTGAQARMFYNEPDVSSMKLNGVTKFLVSIGSGFRAHPLDEEIEDKFFMVVDHYPYGAIPSSETNYTKDASDLAQITVTSTGAVSQSDSIKDGSGWMVNFSGSGEKVLASSVVIDGTVLFTTLLPLTITDEDYANCSAPPTEGRLYAIDILSGDLATAPLAFEDGETDTSGAASVDTGYTDSSSVFKKITSLDIPGTPQAVFNPLEVDEVTGICTHAVDLRVGKKLSQATGYDACRLESIYWSDPETN